jgi:hypothetical protein
MFVVDSDRFRKHDEETVLSCTLPGQAHMNTNPKVEKMVEKYTESAPILKNFEEGYSTFHKVAIPATV